DYVPVDGSTGNGAYTSGGTAFNRSLTPQFQIPDDGDDVDAVSVNIAFEALADRTQYLQKQLLRTASYLVGVGDVGGRLTLTSGAPVPTAEVTSPSTLYWTPYRSGGIYLYFPFLDRWQFFSSPEVSLALTGLTSGKNYDVFLASDDGVHLFLHLGA